MGQTKTAESEPIKSLLQISRQQQVFVNVLRTANYLRNHCAPVFDCCDITAQQYNVLRILRGAGPEGLPTLDIIERMIDQAPGITRLLDRLEAKKLVRRERPSGNRRQVICYVTTAGLDLLNELEAPLREHAAAVMRNLKKSEMEELIRLLELVRNGEV